MLYSCTHMATVGVKPLRASDKQFNQIWIVIRIQDSYLHPIWNFARYLSLEIDFDSACLDWTDYLQYMHVRQF